MSSPEIDDDLLARGGVRVSHYGAVTTVTLDRPEVRNAQTPATWAALAEAGRALAPATRVVVVRGEGQSFSAGLDRRMLSPEGLPGEPPLLELLALDDAGIAARIAEFQEGFSWLRRDDVVSIAAVQGHAVGAGFQLALACDLRVLATDARLSMREPALGLVPDLTGTKPLVELVGYARALEICATARTVGAREAAELGLATVVVEPQRLEQAVDELVTAVTAHPAGAVRETKALLRGAGAVTAEEQYVREREAQVRRFRELAALLGTGGR